MIIWIASFPRSGNNLFRTALYQLFGIPSGSVFFEPAGSDPFFDEVSLHLPSDQIDALREREAPVFVKTHRLVEADDESPAVYLVRDGRDSIVSWAHFVKAREERAYESLSHRETLAELIVREDHPFGSWSASVRAWTRREAPTSIVRFEELVEDPAYSVRSALESLGVSLPAPSGELPSFEELHERNPIVFRRGEVGSWTSELPEDLEREFWELHGAEMLAMGYSRDHPLAGAAS
jgi:hypothetical protein